MTLPFSAADVDEVELAICDLGLARALWEGVSTARLLARIRLARDEADLVDVDQRASGMDFADASWDIMLARLLSSSPASFDRVKRAVARHARAAFDEGPLTASDPALAALIHVLLASDDADASPAEGAAGAGATEDSVSLACARFDERLGRRSADRRAAPFEACVELAVKARGTGWPLAALRHAFAALAEASGTERALVAAERALYPWGDDEVPIAERRLCLFERADLERTLLRPERERDAAIARVTDADLPLAKIVAETTALLAKPGALLLVLTREPRSLREAPPVPPSSWLPADIGAPTAAVSLASALELGQVTAPRARSIVLRGGHEALDGIGKEMLNVAAHPFASSVFAEILAQISRERDAVRLVTYFAIAPDPAAAAHALDQCTAPELPSLLKAWLETMLPADGALAAQGKDPQTSGGARVASCIEALAPYPRLHAVVRPLLHRLSELPPKSG